MKKSKKITIIYVVASVLLFATLFFGGGYGIYLSVGINFMRATVGNMNEITDGAEYYDGDIMPSNISYGGSVNFQASMIGVIILSVVLMVLSIAYLISLFKQLIFFKQFKLIRESGLEHAIEKQVKSKSSVVFMAGFLNVLAILVGLAGIFVNATTNFVGGQIWILYVIDALVVVFSLVSFVLLIKKVKENKKHREEIENQKKSASKNKQKTIKEIKIEELDFDDEVDGVDKIEYILIKLKNMKDTKIISEDEYEYFKEKFTGFSKKKIIKKSQNKIAK